MSIIHLICQGPVSRYITVTGDIIMSIIHLICPDPVSHHISVTGAKIMSIIHFICPVSRCEPNCQIHIRSVCFEF